MSILVCDGISLSYGTKEIIRNISFSINEGAKLGIIGVNGAGKSTLASIIAGRITPTSGNVYIPSDVSVGMLAQHNEGEFENKTLYDFALSAFSGLLETEKRLDTLLSKIPENPSLAGEYERLRHDFEIRGGNEYKTRVKSMLSRFGFDSEKWDTPASLLSGGQKTRLALASLLVSGKDIFILDEPTNHLDEDTTRWLEEFVSQSPKTFIIISHDRYFLDKATTETLEIENLTATKYTGSYSAFKEKKKQLREIQQKHYELQQREIKRLEVFIETQRRWGQERNFITIASRQKAIDRMEKVERPKAGPKKINISIHTTASSFSVLSVRGLSKSYGDNKLFDNLSFEITKGEKAVIIGANGCGKSTLLKIINGITEPDKGVCEPGYSQVVGYYDQEVMLLNDENTVIEELIEADNSLLPAQARNILASYGFYGDDAFKKVINLSGGERARLSIAKLVLKKVTFLILDEPTNHLDIPSKEVFEEALLNFEGTVLAVSHDRYFIKTIATRIIEIDKEGYENGYFDFKGNYELFLQKRQKIPPAVSNDKTKSSRGEYEAEKKARSRKRLREKRFGFLSEEIPRLEERLKILEKEYSEYSADYVKLGALYEEITGIKAQLDSLYDEYLTLEENCE
ncbi:MAG: ABC-F family ATP-binding cassette domain-containing protein [Clostridiales bacterium]|nr:ABC-F family ATP-binding cassette domain-containing protein [Clostridiales bacterium]